jgi:glycosyltransferase involved in cell wall biosynthesis
MKKLAVIIPVYLKDNPEFFKKAVQSILEQSYKDFHLFIAADGPLSNPINAYINTLPQTDTHIIQYETNRGLATTLNESIKYAKDTGFEFIARMDADDIAHRDRLKKQMEFLMDYPEVSALGVNAYVIDSHDKLIGFKDAAPHLTYKVLRRRSDIIHPSVIFRASFFDVVGYYIKNVPPAEDYDLWFRAIKAGLTVMSIPERLYYFRYDHKLIERRQNAQKHVITIKKYHMASYEYHHLVQHYIIRIMPKWIIKKILYQTIKQGKGKRIDHAQG